MQTIQPLRAMLLAFLIVPLAAQTWETAAGGRVEGKLSGVYGPLAVISGKAGSTVVVLSELNDAGLERVADFLATRPATPSPWTASTSKVAKALKGRLQVLQGQKLADFDPGTRPEPDFYLVYFGAEWCPPCRAFSPRLVAEYERLKKLAPDKFELLFISSDRTPSEQLSYVRHAKMPFPVLKFSQLGRAEALERWAGRGIPCLVAVTREGDALLHSYRGEEYVGPQDVLNRFEQVLRASETRDPGTKRSLHRLAVMTHVRSAAGSTRAPAPYLISLNPRRYQTLETKDLVATLEIDADGRVLDASVEPELPAVLNHQLLEDARTWLFLPAIKDGRALRQKVALPLKL